MGTTLHNHSGAAKDPVKAAYRLVQQIWDQAMTVTACNRLGEPGPFSFRYLDYISNGTFGVVCRARDLTTNEIVAIKTVYQDEAHQNRELSIGKGLDHINIVATRNYFYMRNESGEVFLSLVLDWMPTSVDRMLRDYDRKPDGVPITLIQHAMKNFAQALEYLHEMGVCHRDIKPHNLLLDPKTGMVKLCDFGCSKYLQPGEANIQYICARYYRAPEILLGWAHYSIQIDLWSAGCVLAELLTGVPLFPGKNSIDQLARIVRLLGTPTPEEMTSMGQPPKQLSSKPPLTSSERRAILRAVIVREPPAPESAIDLLAALLAYEPEQRISPTEMLKHPFLTNLTPLQSFASDGSEFCGTIADIQCSSNARSFKIASVTTHDMSLTKQSTSLRKEEEEQQLSVINGPSSGIDKSSTPA